MEISREAYDPEYRSLRRRRWRAGAGVGETDGGIPVFVFVSAVAVHRDLDQELFERELVERRDIDDVDPRGNRAIDPRFVL